MTYCTIASFPLSLFYVSVPLFTCFNPLLPLSMSFHVTVSLCLCLCFFCVSVLSRFSFEVRDQPDSPIVWHWGPPTGSSRGTETSQVVSNLHSVVLRSHTCLTQ